MGRDQKEGFQPKGMRLPFNNIIYCSGIVSDGIVNITNMKYGHVTLRELIEVEEVPLFSKTTKGKFIIAFANMDMSKDEFLEYAKGHIWQMYIRFEFKKNMKERKIRRIIKWTRKEI